MPTSASSAEEAQEQTELENTEAPAETLAETADHIADTPAETADFPAEETEDIHPEETEDIPAETADLPAETADLPAETADSAAEDEAPDETPAGTFDQPDDTPAVTAATVDPLETPAEIADPDETPAQTVDAPEETPATAAEEAQVETPAETGAEVPETAADKSDSERAAAESDSSAAADHEDDSSESESVAKGDVPEHERRTVIFSNVPKMDEEAFKGRMLKYGTIEKMDLAGDRAEVEFTAPSAAKHCVKALHKASFAIYPDNVLEAKLLRNVLHPGNRSDDDEREDDEDDEDTGARKGMFAKDFEPPVKAIAAWKEDMTIEDQLKDFSRMPRCGLLNRYIVIGNAEEEFLSCEALRKELDWTEKLRTPQGDATEIVSIELHSLSSRKDVAHVTMRDVKAACTLRNYIMELHPSWKIAHCGPRKASKVLWIGGLPPNNDLVPEVKPWYLTPLEDVLATFGKLKGRMRYLPKARCFFISYEKTSEAVRARNYMYGYPIKPEAFGETFYLNVDFAEVEEDEEELEFVPRRRASPRRVRRVVEEESSSESRSPVPLPARRTRRVREEESHSPVVRRRRVEDVRRIRKRLPEPQMKKPLTKKRKIAKETKETKDMKELKEPKEPKEPKQEVKKMKEMKEEVTSPRPNTDGSTRLNLYKMQEFVCDGNAHFLEGNQTLKKGFSDDLRLDIDQRTKVENVVSHKTRNEGRWALWKLAPTLPKDKPAYDELSAYFIARQRVGLVQTKLAHVYILPNDPQFLDPLGLKSEEGHILALQIPVRQHAAAAAGPIKELPTNA